MGTSPSKSTFPPAAKTVLFRTPGCIHGIAVAEPCPECDAMAKTMSDEFWHAAEACDICTHLPLEDAIVCCAKCSGKADRLAKEALRASDLGKA